MGVLVCLLVGFGIGLLMVLYQILYQGIGRRRSLRLEPAIRGTRRPCSLLLPGCWLVVKRRDLLAVQAALRLHHARFCTWVEGLTTADGLFISPPINGWILVVGGLLPNPWKDIDACFRFVLDLSRKTGKVQLFSADRATLRHAWVKAERGRILRAYAWAERTVWVQGLPTREEINLQMTCFDYFEPLPSGKAAGLAANLDKIPLLAAKWGLDPARIHHHLLLKEHGVTGEPAHRY